MYPAIMLAQRHVRAVLLGPANRHYDRRLAEFDEVAQLGPGQLFEKNRIGGLALRRWPGGQQQTRKYQ